VRPLAWSALSLTLLIIGGCNAPANLKDLPSSAHEAFSTEWGDSTWIKTLTVSASQADVLKAAEGALMSAGFEERRDSWSAERRCGRYPHSWRENSFWACFYTTGRSDSQQDVRIIVKSWRIYGMQTPWHLLLATGFRNRIEATQRTR